MSFYKGCVQITTVAYSEEKGVTHILSAEHLGGHDVSFSGFSVCYLTVRRSTSSVCSIANTILFSFTV